MRKVNFGLCSFLGWMFVFIGIGSAIVNNHAADPNAIASPEWWAATSTLFIGPLFLIAAGTNAPTPPLTAEEKK